MKKIIIRSGIIAAIISVVLCVMNYMLGTMYGYIIGITSYDGAEYIPTYGLGVEYATIVPHTSVYDPIHVYHYVSFHPRSFFFTLLIIFNIVLLIHIIIKKLHKLVQKKRNKMNS